MPLVASVVYDMHALTPAHAAEDALELPFLFAPSDFFEAGRLMATITATGRLSAYDTGANDGTETWRGIINKYDVTTDADGNATFGQSTSGAHGEVHQNAPAFVSGWFRTEDLVGLDSGALSDCTRAGIVYGDSTTGLLRVG